MPQNERKPRPRTGEKRETRHPLKIDLLSEAVRDAILWMRNGATRRRTWTEIEDLSRKSYSSKWATDGGGFIDWPKEDSAAVDAFPGLYIPHTTVHRWYDLRFDQVRKELLESSHQARELAEAFAEANVSGDKDAVMNAARDAFFNLQAEDASPGGRLRIAKALLGLAEVMQAARANDIKERKVAADERKLKLLEERERLAIAKLEAETDRLAKKAKAGQPITEDELRSVRMKAFGF